MCLTKTRLDKVRVTGVYITDILDVKTLQKQGIVTVKEDAPSYNHNKKWYKIQFHLYFQMTLI